MSKADLYLNAAANYPLPFDRRRRQKDRRRQPTPMISRYLFVGSRRANQRQSDPQSRYYVDRPCKELVLRGVLVILLGVLDAVLTFLVLKRGGMEINPLVKLWLYQGWSYCLAYKFSFMVFGIFILLLHQNFFKMKYVISLILLFYAALICYQSFLLLAA